MATDNHSKTKKESENDSTKFYTTAGLSAAEFLAKMKQLDSVQDKFWLFDQFAQDVQSSPHNVSYLRDGLKKIIGIGENMCQKTTKILDSKCECLSPQDVCDILEDIQQAKVEMANFVVKVGLATSAVIIVLQIWRLYEVWCELKDAENVLDDSGTNN